MSELGSVFVCVTLSSLQGGPTSQYVAEITYMGIIAIQGPYDSAAEAASEFVLWRLLFVLRGKSPLLVFLGLMRVRTLDCEPAAIP